MTTARVAAYTVVANAEAVSLLVDDPTDLRFDDLRAAGWNLDGPIAEDGGVTITASKPFLSPEELPGLLDELIEEDVVFSNVALEQAHDFSMLGLRPAETSYDFAADVDPAPDLEILGDAVIEGLLGSSLGRSLTRVEEDAGGSFAGSLGLVVNVQLPANVATDSESASRSTMSSPGSSPTATPRPRSMPERRSTRSCPGCGPWWRSLRHCCLSWWCCPAWRPS